jgi:hypothetical protein
MNDDFRFVQLVPVGDPHHPHAFYGLANDGSVWWGTLVYPEPHTRPVDADARPIGITWSALESVL